MSVQERRIEFEEEMHKIRLLVHTGKITYIAAIARLRAAFTDEEQPWWMIEKRYNKSWIKEPLTPGLLRQEIDIDFQNTKWHKLDITNIVKEDKPAHIGPDIYKYLGDSGLLNRCPSIEALDFYEKNPKLREKDWDYTNNWVYAWRDAALSNRADLSIVVPGMLVHQKTGKVFRKWRSLQRIGDTRFKVLVRK